MKRHKFTELRRSSTFKKQVKLNNRISIFFVNDPENCKTLSEIDHSTLILMCNCFFILVLGLICLTSTLRCNAMRWEDYRDKKRVHSLIELVCINIQQVLSMAVFLPILLKPATAVIGRIQPALIVWGETQHLKTQVKLNNRMNIFCEWP